MLKNQITRSLLAIGTAATLWSAPTMLPAAELHPLVVTGIALDRVALVHPTPEYPRFARALRVDGKVKVEVTVENGRIVDATASSSSSMLAYSAKNWIVRCWKFKPEVTGRFTIPIDYKLQA